MAKFCTNCGSELNPGTKFCVNCGQKVEQEQNPQAAIKRALMTALSRKGLLLPMLKKMYILTLMLILMVIAILRLILILMNLSIPMLPVKLTPMRIALRQYPKQARSF